MRPVPESPRAHPEVRQICKFAEYQWHEEEYCPLCDSLVQESDEDESCSSITRTSDQSRDLGLQFIENHEFDMTRLGLESDSDEEREITLSSCEEILYASNSYLRRKRVAEFLSIIEGEAENEEKDSESEIGDDDDEEPIDECKESTD